MYLRKILVRRLLALYPAMWRKEYGEEMYSMLLAQPLTASVVGDVFFNAMRQNLRRPDPWKIAALFLICWRSFCIVLPSTLQLSPAAWELSVQIDRGVFLLVALFAGCWTVINEGDVLRGACAGWWSTMLGDLLPLAAFTLLLSLAPDKSVPSWVFVTPDRLFDHHSLWYDTIPRVPASLCGAMLGLVVRKRRMSTVDTRR